MLAGAALNNRSSSLCRRCRGRQRGIRKDESVRRHGQARWPLEVARLSTDLRLSVAERADAVIVFRITNPNP